MDTMTALSDVGTDDGRHAPIAGNRGASDASALLVMAQPTVNNMKRATQRRRQRDRFSGQEARSIGNPRETTGAARLA